MRTLHTFYSHKSIPHRCISNCLNQHHSEDFQCIPVAVYGRLFDFTKRNRPSSVFLSLSDYSQEVHDWVEDYQNSVNIFLLLDKKIGTDNSDLWSYLCASNIKMIINSHFTPDAPSNHLSYDSRYDSACFSNKGQDRNDKIAVMSDSVQSNKDIINELLYPNTKLKINIFNDVDWETPQNVGMLDPVQLNEVLNHYSVFVDLTSSMQLEAQACGIPYIDTSGDLKQDITDNKFKSEIDKLDKRTWAYFTEHEVLPYIRNNT